jgi:hypothetical protein
MSLQLTALGVSGTIGIGTATIGIPHLKLPTEDEHAETEEKRTPFRGKSSSVFNGRLLLTDSLSSLFLN